MLVVDKKITMTADEAREFADATFAPWSPRTIDEFQAMCDLASARHRHENTNGVGYMFAIAVEGMKFGEDGSANFPMNREKLEHLRKHGTWPNGVPGAEGGQDGQPGAPGGLRRVK